MQQQALIRAGLKAGHTVISADTNLRAATVKSLAEIAVFFGAGVEVIDFDTPVEECIRRDKLRGHPKMGGHTVGEEVILKFYNKYFVKGRFPTNPVDRIESVTFEPYAPDVSKPKAMLIDLDGTTADKHANRTYYDYTTVDLDSAHDDVIDLIRLLSCEYKAVYVSGRPDSCRDLSQQWIDKYIGIPGPLFMRSTGDGRADFIIKLELFDKHIRHEYNVVCAIDDRDQVVKAYRDVLGLRVYQVQEGNY